MPLTRATAVLAAEPFAGEREAERWLLASTEAEEEAERVVEKGLALLNRALFAQGTASAEPNFRQLTSSDASTVRIGYGSGDEVAAGRYTAARHVDVRASGTSRRRRRAEELRPQERVAAVLGGRERIDACEAPLLRARADLDAGRRREAALQLSIGLEALLVELEGALTDPGHAEDMTALRAGRQAVREASAAAIAGELDEKRVRDVADLLEVCERVLRRRRVLRGG